MSRIGGKMWTRKSTKAIWLKNTNDDYTFKGERIGIVGKNGGEVHF